MTSTIPASRSAVASAMLAAWSTKMPLPAGLVSRARAHSASEIVYYFDPPDVSALAEKAFRSLRPGGDIVLVHWTGATDYPLSGDEAAERFIGVIDPTLRVVRGNRYDSFRIDVLSCR